MWWALFLARESIFETTSQVWTRSRIGNAGGKFAWRFAIERRNYQLACELFRHKDHLVRKIWGTQTSPLWNDL